MFMKNTFKYGNYTFELYHTRFFVGEWRWRLKHSNGNIMAASSEGYKNRLDCLDNFKTVCFVGSDIIKENLTTFIKVSF